MTVAYDYAKQEWITDSTKAAQLRLAQTREELALLRGSGGESYAHFINVNRARYLATMEAQERALMRDYKLV